MFDILKRSTTKNTRFDNTTQDTTTYEKLL